MDGPRNLFFTFLIKEVNKNSIKIREIYGDHLNYLKDKTLSELMNIEARSTIEVLNRRSLPIRVFELHDINGACLSQIMMQYMLEVILIGCVNNIDPFGQSAVEERKILANNMLKGLQ
jgi:glucose-6-phosphate isomerase